jgi:hypothetical protein
MNRFKVQVAVENNEEISATVTAAAAVRAPAAVSESGLQHHDMALAEA